MENRHGKRCRAFALAEILGKDGNLARGLVYNVSRDGMFIVNTSKLGASRYINIRLPHIIKNDKPLQLSGMIVHRNKAGFGLMFHKIDNTTRSLISKLITQRCSV